MKELKQAVIADFGYDEWQVSLYGQLVCPCGHNVEDDGNCPNGHESPLRQEALI